MSEIVTALSEPKVRVPHGGDVRVRKTTSAKLSKVVEEAIRAATKSE